MKHALNSLVSVGWFVKLEEFCGIFRINCFKANHVANNCFFQVH